MTPFTVSSCKRASSFFAPSVSSISIFLYIIAPVVIAMQIKQKTITIYEKAESDFNDSNIISDDSVLRYIAKKIQD